MKPDAPDGRMGAALDDDSMMNSPGFL